MRTARAGRAEAAAALEAPRPKRHRTVPYRQSPGNYIMQEEQQQVPPVQGGSSCDECTAAGKNPNHHHRFVLSSNAPIAGAGITVGPSPRINTGAISS
ncbi:hypothetical protein [Marinobacter sp.]|uniref:hypothetical protein n=1 Tax=Marinobacter sp. TaxID=50741 RepID=UPI0032987A8D